MTPEFNEHVHLKYQVYNSLFLILPFGDILKTGTLLPLLGLKCAEELEEGRNPRDIIEDFLAERVPNADPKVYHDVLFAFIKYVERQVVLFDAVEDAAFPHVHDLTGPGTLPDFFSRVRIRDKSEVLQKKLQDFSLRLVLTAHPTQFYPARVLSIISDLDAAIRNNEISEINEILYQLGKTPMIQKEKPTPLTEAVRLIWYLENVFYESIGSIAIALSENTGMHVLDLPLENLIRIGFWPGGDRDGNPFVNYETTLQVARRLKRTGLVCYNRDLRKLRRRLTFKNVYHRVQAIIEKVSLGITNVDDGYGSVDEMLADLHEIRQELLVQGLDQFTVYVDQMIARVRIFGFHFATIDVRQDSSVLDALYAQLMAGTDFGNGKKWEDLTVAERFDLLPSINVAENKLSFDDPVQDDVIGSIRAMASIRNSNGESACQRYIISNSQSELHVGQVYHLIRWTLGDVAFDIVPLFETVDDLQAAGDIMTRLYNDDTYGPHLARQGNVQHIMLGFSDGTKDGGYLMANWSIFRAKEEITRVSREHGIQVVFFDGRGGPPARGGGKSHRFYASLGSGIEDKEVQLTVQGQTISSNFGTVQSARYNLEELFTAGMENSVFKGDIGDISSEGREVINQLAESSYASYRALKQDDDFLPYLEQLGTLPYYGMTNIGSRPVKRSGSSKLTLSSLRAIPFVGSWHQMKQNVPGFYGFGTALDAFKQRGELDKVKKLYRESLFFHTLVDNSMMSLCKTYFPLTQYLQNDPRFGDLWKRIYDEFILTRDLLLEVSGQSELLEDAPNGNDSIKLREQLVLPVLTIQQYALQKSRELEAAGDSEGAGVYHTMVMRTMYAIINAGRNSA